MIRYAAAAALICALALPFGPGANAGEAIAAPLLASFDGAGIERGIVRVICVRRGSEIADRVRAIVLDVSNGAPKREVLLAPAHSLPQDEGRILGDCRVVHGHGAPGRISAYWLPDIRHSGTGDDWVVLMTESRFSGAVGRLRAGQASQNILNRLIAEERSIAVMLFTDSSDQRDCQIRELLQPMLFSHSCTAWAGLSGSPIVIGVNGEPMVFGMQIGSLTRPTAHQRGPVTSGIGLAIDDAIAAAIREAARRASD